MRAFRIVLPFAVSLLGVAAFGCGNKAQDCKAIIDTIDDDDAALKAINLDSDDPAALSKNMKAAADIVDKVATDLAAKKISNTDLQKYSGEYQDFAKGLAKELRGTADLMTQLGGTLEKLGPMAKSFSTGLHKLRTRCDGAEKGTKADCDAVKKAMKDAPDQDAFKFDKDLKDDADAFAKFAGELKNLQLTDADVKADLEEIVKGLGALEQVMRELSELKPKFDANQASLRTVLAKEAPIERHINDTCSDK